MARKKEAPAPAKIRLKKGDIVKVMVGRDKGKQGRILEVDRDRGKVLVEGCMMIKRHTRPNPARQIKGGVAERESFIHVSNVMVVTSNGEPSRIGYRVEELGGGVVRRVRIARKTGEILDKKA
ncbi:MAG: 50S ribosomal protein L24 [Bryobacterales bacterium]|nr:50S ribosomal protein L24 [Bryobacterales bacterium]